MRRILIVGAGQAGLQLALGLQAHGYQVTLVSNRTPDEIRTGRVMSTQCMFHTALQHERDLEVNFWESQTPRIDGVGFSVAMPDGTRGLDWVGRLDRYAQSVDQRVKMAGWMETFAERGGQLVIHGVAVSDLDWFARTYDLVLLAAGKGELVSMFERDPERSPYTVPQRCLAVAYVHGLAPRPEHDFAAVRLNLVPGVGEMVIMDCLTTTGPCAILFWLGIPGGPADVFERVQGPDEHLRLTLELMERYTPWEYARAAKVELTDPMGTMAGRYTPTVRRPVAVLPSGGLALGVADVVVANDPVTGQGSNSASKCAAAYLAAILERGDRPFDLPFMTDAFDRFWESAAPVTRWTNRMLAPWDPHMMDVLAAAERYPRVADRLANGFDTPSDFDDYFLDADRAAAYLAEETGVDAAAGVAPAAGG